MNIAVIDVAVFAGSAILKEALQRAHGVTAQGLAD